ncbi:GNAT family N-acetyltransferase [Oryzobacter telluris]|uniref:GNAT family N-acetyltransferase n=1 Tax=Oryzobacter telluris TaxID=3149179 RepID=UPI00370D3F05
MTTIRTATAADLPAIAAIYNDAVDHAISTFDTVHQPPEHFADRVASTRPGDHVLVAQDGDDVIGFAYASTYRPRPAYDGSRETSVYLHERARGRGLGRAIYTELLDRLDADGVHVVVAVIAQPNPASEALHAALGFERVGALREVGHKFGAYVDTAFWQRFGPAAR